ncbi:Hypothetical protein LDBND_0965 [Lactobacillus delbrueckii subsp. bulgaricus ND02]|nr:Hypothetical protein LDBND_0965 [Lactobacillus delbrueckii subsp. bulgaricus ND02]
MPGSGLRIAKYIIPPFSLKRLENDSLTSCVLTTYTRRSV